MYIASISLNPSTMILIFVKRNFTKILKVSLTTLFDHLRIFFYFNVILISIEESIFDVSRKSLPRERAI